MDAADVDEPGRSNGDDTKNKVNFFTYKIGRDLLLAEADVDEPGVSDGDETKNKVNFQTY